jgi:NAD(P)-dependent dehydrogenase (short-subunit alcohol dehydrogenase family)
MSKTWFITGTSSGFGLEMTERLLERGDRVAATLRKPAVLQTLKARYGEQLWLAQLDVTDAESVRTVVDRAFAELGRIDVVVSNAGYGLGGAAEELADAQIERLLDTNVLGSIQLIRAALPHLRQQGGGRILQLSSMGGQITFPGLSLYHTSKFAMEGFVETVAQEVAAFNIEFTLVEPGTAQTGFTQGMEMAEPLAAYDRSPMRQLMENWPTVGEAKKMVREMIASVDRSPAPRRLTLGSDAYTLVHAALTERLAALEAQKEIAFSTDVGR